MLVCGRLREDRSRREAAEHTGFIMGEKQRALLVEEPA
jgi:hypothetical protein